MEIRRIFENRIFNRENIIRMLECRGEEEACLYEYAGNLRKKTLGNYVYLRGLVEISNHCRKNCLYCGIRRDNSRASRYSLSDAEIIEAAEKAYVRNYGSIVLQGGEICSPEFTHRMEELIRKIKKIGSRPLGITLSLGEQNEETYRRWFAAGAHRYLLRIESSNRNIFRDIHPADALHSYETRLDCIKNLQKCGYQTGTGVMIGLPGQNTEDLCNDLMFIRENDIDMVGFILHGRNRTCRFIRFALKHHTPQRTEPYEKQGGKSIEILKRKSADYKFRKQANSKKRLPTPSHKACTMSPKTKQSQVCRL